MSAQSNQRNNKAPRNSRGYTRPSGAGRRRKSSKAKYVVFALELVVVAVMVVALYFVTRVTEKGKGPTKVVLDPVNLGVHEEVEQNEVMKGYMNVALFGVDISREKKDAEGNVIELLPAGNLRKSGLLKGFRSDTIMIASVNLDTGDIKLVSVYRDTFLYNGEDYSKCNAAYSKGGAERAIQMLNTNLDMDIKNSVTVSYWALVEIIDALGGVYIDVDKDELKHLNNYGTCIGQTMDVSYKPLASPGYQLLTGMQAAAYCRIRYVGNDFARAARQREVLKAIEEQAKKADVASLLEAFENAQDDIATTLKEEDIITLISHLWDYRIADEDGFPKEEYRTTKNMGAKGSCVVPVDLETNVKWLHEFLFDEKDYKVSSTVKEHSDYIRAYYAKYANNSN